MNPYIIPGLRREVVADIPKLKSTIKDSAKDNRNKVFRLSSILLEYSNIYHQSSITWLDIQGTSRSRDLVELRQMYCFICRTHNYLASLEAIGTTINRHHTTILYAVDSIKNLLAAGDERITNLHNYIITHL